MQFGQGRSGDGRGSMTNSADSRNSDEREKGTRQASNASDLEQGEKAVDRYDSENERSFQGSSSLVKPAGDDSNSPTLNLGKKNISTSSSIASDATNGSNGSRNSKRSYVRQGSNLRQLTPNRRTTRFVPSSSRPLRAALSVRANQAALKQRKPRKSIVSLLTSTQIGHFGNMHLDETLLREMNLVREIAKWSCDIFKLSEASNGDPLVLVCASLWRLMDIKDIKEVQESTFLKFMVAVQSNYINTNTYHNSMHAADVTQTMSVLLGDPTISTILNEKDRFCGVIAGAIHDMGHPGTNNNFGINTSSIWAIRYNDLSILENMHVSKAFQLMMENEDNNVLGGFNKEVSNEMRENIINMVLGTDMSNHFEDISHFQAQVSTFCFVNNI